MASLLCLPPEIVKKLKVAASESKIDLAKLYDMSSAERRAMFTDYSKDKSLGKLLNTEFEKAMISKQQDALQEWAGAVFSPSSKQGPIFKSITDKINELTEIGVLNPESEKAFLQDLVTDKLGMTVTPEEVKIISAKAKVIDEAQKALGDNMGVPGFKDQNIAFFKAKKDMDNYLQSHNPASNTKVLISTVGRGMMLFSIKSPILNISSNIEVGLTEALARRIASGSIKVTDNSLARGYAKMSDEVYKKTGYDLSRMMSLSDGGSSGQRVLGNVTHAQGPRAIRAVGRVVEDVVFSKLMGGPDAKFGSIHFADSVNISSLKMAGGDKAKARELMIDAMRVTPTTEDGGILKAQGVLDAQVATWTNPGHVSEFSLGLRKVVNAATGDIGLGDFLYSFIKTPANVIETSLDYAGLGVYKSLYYTVKAIRAGDLKEYQVQQKISHNLVRAGIGLAAASAICYSLKPEDFMGAYDPARQQIETLRNSNTNSVRIGGHWINLDWAGPITIGITAQMYAKKYGQGTVYSSLQQYGKGLKAGAENTPVLKDIADYYKKQAYAKSNTNQSASDASSGIFNYAINQAYSRLVPSFIGDIAKGTDKYQRTSAKGIQGIKNNIPGLREQSPIKKDVFGNDLKGEGLVSTILFGSRVKTDKDTPLLKELASVGKANDKAVNFTDMRTSSAKGVVEFKNKIGKDKFDKATTEYGQKLQTNLEKLTTSDKYKNADDQTKFALINKTDGDTQKQLFKDYNFKPTRTKSILSKIK